MLDNHFKNVLFFFFYLKIYIFKVWFPLLLVFLCLELQCEETEIKKSPYLWKFYPFLKTKQPHYREDLMFM